MGHCTSCGSWIPDDQGKSCSMCYGDPGHGHDGYYQAYLDEQERQHRPAPQEEEPNTNY
jgi:hypothetical protein